MRRCTQLSLFSFLTLSLAMPLIARGDGGPDADAISETQTAYVGARLLRANEGVEVVQIGPGIHEDDGPERDRYMFWEGDSLFAGVIDEESGNRMDFVAEFYWFESSVDRNADFYLVVLKANAIPSPNTNWRVATEQSWVDNMMLRDIGPVQVVDASIDRSGAFGAIRWDWCIPFQNYRWEPSRVIEVEQKYAAGAQAEGGAMYSVTEDVNIQAKGFASANYQVKSRYTITLWRWQMLVRAGATDMGWNLVALDPEHSQDPAYHEYFLVLQAERGEPVNLNNLRFATTLREDVFLLPDRFMELSASIDGVQLTAPPNPVVCDPGYRAVDDSCERICAEGEEWQLDRCVVKCGPGYEEVNGQCLVECADGHGREGNECVILCEGNFRAEGDRCVPNCDIGFRPAGDICVPDCAAGYIPMGSGCVRDCPAGSHAEGDDCVLNCPPGTYHDNGECVAVTPDLQCGPGTRMEGDVCVPDGSVNGDRPADEECSLHVDCPLGSHCELGSCVSRCLADMDCGGGMACNERAMCVWPETRPSNDISVPQAGTPQTASSEAGGCAQAPTVGQGSMVRRWIRGWLGR